MEYCATFGYLPFEQWQGEDKQPLKWSHKSQKRLFHSLLWVELPNGAGIVRRRPRLGPDHWAITLTNYNMRLSRPSTNNLFLRFQKLLNSLIQYMSGMFIRLAAWHWRTNHWKMFSSSERRHSTQMLSTRHWRCGGIPLIDSQSGNSFIKK